jgi:hypothetical protein
VEITQRATQPQAEIRRRPSLAGIALTCLVALTMVCPSPADAGVLGRVRHTRDHFKNTMPGTVRADHPAVQPVVAAIRAVTLNPLEQLSMVNDVTHLLVDYDDDERVYGAAEYHATFDEMLARRRQAGWIYLRDDCDGRAVFAAHLLAALGISWRLEASYWKEHAWIVARVNGRDYDLLDLRNGAPETDRVSYKVFGRHFVRPSVRPPAFSWRRAWAQRTGRDFQVGLTLGLLAVDSRPEAQHERYATDWTARVPSGKLSPVDDRALTSRVAGFPLGEPLHINAMAAGRPVPAEKPAAPAVALGGTTDSPASGGN